MIYFIIEIIFKNVYYIFFPYEISDFDISEEIKNKYDDL